MELRKLHYFVAVAQDLHFARAAQRLHLSQQALSFQIKQLEHELGTPLFERTTRHVKLTAAGQAFLNEVQLALEHLRHGIQSAQRAGRGEIGRLKVGYLSSTLYNILPSTVRVFRERYPEVEVILQEMIPPTLEEAILSGEIDIGLAGLSGRRVSDLNYEVLYRDTVAVALPKGHPLEVYEGIPLAALAAEPFVMYSRLHKKQSYDLIIALCQQAGFSPQIVQEAATEQAVISLVAAGAGVALVVNSLRTVRADEVTYRCLIDPVIEANFGTLWRQDNQSQLVKAFVQTAHDMAAEPVL